jgi:nucleoside-diphosphate-sugar epimerase
MYYDREDMDRLGYECEVPFDEGLRQTIDWYTKEHP